MTELQIITLIAFLLFYLPAYARLIGLLYIRKLLWTAIYLLIIAAILAYFSNTYYVFIFQLLIVASRIIEGNSVKLKNKGLFAIAYRAEIFVLFLVLFLILITPIPFKTIIMLALVGNRILYYLKRPFKTPILNDRYILYWMFPIFYLAVHFRHAL